MTSLEHMEEAIEAAKLMHVCLLAAHDAPNEPALRACMGAFETHCRELHDHLRPVIEKLSRDSRTHSPVSGGQP